MIIPNLIVPSLVNKEFKFYSPDTLDNCVDKKHFKKYPHDVHYKFNSRGFRDAEWPNDLKNAIWCLGDSATVGIGSPSDHGWVKQLEKITNLPTINLGLRATDNYTISQIAQEIIVALNPKNMMILWSFFERRPVNANPWPLVDTGNTTQLVIDDDRIHIEYFKECVLKLNKVAADAGTNIAYGFCTNYCSLDFDSQHVWNNVRDSSWPEKLPDLDQLPDYILCELDKVHNVLDLFKIFTDWDNFRKKHMKNVIKDISVLDLARDGWHWDLLTSRNIAVDFKNKLV